LVDMILARRKGTEMVIFCFFSMIKDCKDS
jgi:hypothetical protein